MAKKSSDKDPFSQFAWTKSLSVSNAPLQACSFEAAKAALDSNQPSNIRLFKLIESDEHGVTARKDGKSAGEQENDATFAHARYATLPQGTDAVLITFDLKVHNATALPQTANLSTWEKLKKPDGAVLDGRSMSIHEALTARAREIFDLVGQQVFSGSWAWRNRYEATAHQIVVVCETGTAIKTAEDLGQAMFQAFSTNIPHLWKVYGLFKLGAGSSRVAFPSQLLKPKDPSKVSEFYRIPSTDGQGDFALRAVKVGNRLKAIDTWYARYDLLQQAIPVEPMGYAHNLRATLRKKDETAVDILTRLVQADSASKKTLSEQEALYLCAITLFGGLITAEKPATTSPSEAGA